MSSSNQKKNLNQLDSNLNYLRLVQHRFTMFGKHRIYVPWNTEHILIMGVGKGLHPLPRTTNELYKSFDLYAGGHAIKHSNLNISLNNEQ